MTAPRNRHLASRLTNAHPSASAAQRTRPVSTGDDLGLYLHQIARTPLLSADQERRLARRIHFARAGFQRHALREPEVLLHLIECLQQYRNREIRVDSLFELSLRDKSRRSELERRLKQHLPLLEQLRDRLVAAREHASPASEPSRLAEAARCLQTLQIRQRHYEQAPFQHPRTRRLLAAYRRYCRQLANSNLRLVVSAVKRLTLSGGCSLDLIQEGNRGLLRAVTRFDYRRGHRFSTCAIPWIRKSILAALPNAERLIPVPDPFRKTHRETVARLQSAPELAGHGSEDHQLAAAGQLTLLEANWYLNVQRDVTSLNQTNDSDSAGRRGGLRLVDETAPDPAAEVARRDERDQIREMLETLTEREHEVLRFRFGLDDGISRSLSQVGKALRFSRERVRQLEKSALAKLAAQANARFPYLAAACP